MKWKPLFAVLLGLLMIGMAAGSAAAMPSPSQNSHTKAVVMKEFPTKLLVDTPTRQTFVFGDLLVDYRTNGIEAKIIITNTTTGEIIDVVHLTSTKINDSYILTMEDTSGTTYSIRTPINMIDPGLKTKQLISKPGINKESSNIMTLTTQQHYWWDGVYFVKGYMIRYPHPDYEYYGIEPWDTASIKGNKLTHLHFSWAKSKFLLDAGPTALGAAIGAYFANVPGAVIGAITGLAAGITFGNYLLDEHGCLWVWFAWKWEYHWRWIPPGYEYGPVLKYLRIASYTLKNDYHLSNP
ncbi:glycine zipper family protein [Thermococcus pacificus]|uniref:Uncharacterized protein n=1 Tax=Thermococcus pacificus TaxID=71998 RepID=A0A218P6H6_9EURY|nr:glycine zipper family protein [Thermococcus pacificus]ASJ06360.1 hypothetical protein A3L08_02935 [Thermococcus pacificus]